MFHSQPATNQQIREAILLHLQGKSEPIFPRFSTEGAARYADSKVSCYRHELENVLYRLTEERKVSGYRLRCFYGNEFLALEVFDWDITPRLELRFIEPTPYPKAEQTRCETLTEIAKLALKLIP